MHFILAFPLLAVAASALLQHLAVYASTAAGWLAAHPQIDLGLAFWIALSLANKLQSNPATAQSPAAKVFRRLADVLSLLPHSDARGFIGGLLMKYMNPGTAQNLLQLLFGWFNLPILPSAPVERPAAAASNVVTKNGSSAVLGSGGGALAFAVFILALGTPSCAFFAREFGPTFAADEFDCVKNVPKQLEDIAVAKLKEIFASLSLSTAGAHAAADSLESSAAAALGPVGNQIYMCASGVIADDYEKAHPVAAPDAGPAPGQKNPIVAAQSALTMGTINAAQPQDLDNLVYIRVKARLARSPVKPVHR